MNDPVSGRRARLPNEKRRGGLAGGSAAIFDDEFDGVEIIGPSR